MTPAKIIELIIRALPHPHLIRDIDIGINYVRFTWRGSRYSVNERGDVEEVGDGVLIGSDRAILMRTCLEQIQAYDAAHGARSEA